MGFKSEHQNYLTYESDDFYVNSWPDNLSSNLEGFIAKHCQSGGGLKNVINDIASRIPCELTQNWGWDFLISDLSSYLSRFEKTKFHKLMDFLSDFYELTEEDIEIENFNEFLEDSKIGYILNYDPIQGYNWTLRESVTNRIENITESALEVKDICTQTLDHLNQAKSHLTNTQNNRDRKDAIRDCMSAMEAMLKTITNENDIKKATKNMRQENIWGADIIVKDGLSIWNRLHDLYPDVRHGNPDESNLTDNETLYWVERIICYIKYIAKVHKNNA